ncbi:MAG: aldo/keto reductase family oxidoreductase [Chitinophagaceae bacterium]
MNQANVTLSKLIIGCMRWGIWGAKFNIHQYQKTIEWCINKGLTSFDHADIYGDYTTEVEFGNALRQMKIQRESIQLITKCGINMPCNSRPEYQVKAYDTSTAYIIESVERSLRNLQTEYIDILLIHRPSPLMHPDEIAKAVENLTTSCKIKAFGVSNFKPSQVAMLATSIMPTYNQIEASLLQLSSFTDGTLDQCIEKKIKPMAWSPLAGGNISAHQKLQAITQKIAAQYAATEEAIMLSFLAKHPSKIISVIGTSNTERMEKCLAFQDITLSNQDFFELYSTALGRDIP